MTFLELQQELARLHMDTSTAMIAGGSTNKQNVKDGYSELFDRVKTTEKVKRYLNLQKTKITITGKIGTLPADFDTIDKVSTVDFTLDSDISLSPYRYYDFEIRGSRATKKIYLEADISEVYISYIPILTQLSADGDIPVLPFELHRSIANFAMIEYNRNIRDEVGVANSISYAEQVLNEKMKRL